ncbi:RICIN domain-containing protein [Georgenia sp. AZ-5]|uniref:RICIN domain-containing protein n=1 Tax=Georgenia sp. AZ-5 TaxID=3367526 RepID=UPI003754460D
MTVGFGDLLFGVPLTGVATQGHINRHRAALGLLPVFVDADLSSAAGRHTSDMSANPWVYKTPARNAHISSDNRTTPAERITAAALQAGWRPERTGEILYWGGALLNGDAPFNWWMGSPPHRQIIEDGAYTHLGFSASHTDSANEWVYCVTFARAPARGLFARHSDRVIDVKDLSTANGAVIHQWEWWGGGNQRWRLEPTGGGYARIVSQLSGKVLDVANLSTANGAVIHQWEWWGGDNQQFRPEPYGIGELKLTARHSGKVIEVAGIDEGNGALIQQWDWWGGANQRWKY